MCHILGPIVRGTPVHRKAVPLVNHLTCAACDNCDNCLAGRLVTRSSSVQPFPIDSQVVHKIWGPGLVMRYAGDTIVVLCDSVGYRTLAVDLVIEEGLLAPRA
jgi:hypothetical protein